MCSLPLQVGRTQHVQIKKTLSNNGKGGIRTLGSFKLRRFSKPMHSTTLPPSLYLITLKPFKFVLNRQCFYRSLLKLKSGWVRYGAASVSFFTLSAKHVLPLFARSPFASFLLWPKPTRRRTSRNNLCKALATSTLV